MARKVASVITGFLGYCHNSELSLMAWKSVGVASKEEKKDDDCKSHHRNSTPAGLSTWSCWFWMRFYFTKMAKKASIINIHHDILCYLIFRRMIVELVGFEWISILQAWHCSSWNEAVSMRDLTVHVDGVKPEDGMISSLCRFPGRIALSIYS